ncbi:MAG TPA: isochorismatase family protein, partial [Methylophaga sp.]|nr:isochorismatase family protein [Methylophaga sp.]
MSAHCPLIATKQGSVLVLIDIQQRLTTVMPDGIGQRLIAQVAILLKASQALSIPVIVTEQYP